MQAEGPQKIAKIADNSKKCQLNGKIKSVFLPDAKSLQLWQHDSLLLLVLALAVRITGLAHLVGLEEQYLT